MVCNEVGELKIVCWLGNYDNGRLNIDVEYVKRRSKGRICEKFVRMKNIKVTSRSDDDRTYINVCFRRGK